MVDTGAKDVMGGSVGCVGILSIGFSAFNLLIAGRI
jgi:hypothetical protein